MLEAALMVASALLWIIPPDAVALLLALIVAEPERTSNAVAVALLEALIVLLPYCIRSAVAETELVAAMLISP